MQYLNPSPNYNQLCSKAICRMREHRIWSSIREHRDLFETRPRPPLTVGMGACGSWTAWLRWGGCRRCLSSRAFIARTGGAVDYSSCSISVLQVGGERHGFDLMAAFQKKLNHLVHVRPLFAVAVPAVPRVASGRHRAASQLRRRSHYLEMDSDRAVSYMVDE